jgi:tRNA dimethylallyltransferase
MQLSSPTKLLIIVGPTSSGKSEMAVKLAKKFDGEIINADSRQVYKGMNLGTGKIKGKWITTQTRGRAFKKYKYKNITHYLIDFVNPKRQYSAALFQRDAKKAIEDITKRGKLPILTGGTAHFIDTVVYNLQIPNVKPNLKLRSKLEKLSTQDLFATLKKRDPVRAKNIDKHNRRRLIRALEIIFTTGRAVPPLSMRSGQAEVGYKALWIGINVPQTSLFKKIDERLKQRIKQGMINEIKRLHKQGLSYKRLESFGLEYRYISLYLQKKINYDVMIEQLAYDIKHYSKRQLTWWKRNKEIIWIKPEIKKTEKLIKPFLSP